MNGARHLTLAGKVFGVCVEVTRWPERTMHPTVQNIILKLKIGGLGTTVRKTKNF